MTDASYEYPTYECQPRMWLLTALVAAALVVLCVGLGLLCALSSVSVRVNMDATHILAGAPLNGRNVENLTLVSTPRRAVELNRVAELTRQYVIGRNVTLPRAANGVEGYDSSSVSHLRDVRVVIVAALWVILGASALNLLALLYALKARKLRGYLRGCTFAGATVLFVALVAGVCALLDFNTLFTKFHGLFFASGTWTFPAESLLIQTFPLDFWVRELVIWVVISVFCAVFSLILGVYTRKRVAKTGFSVN